MLLSSMFLKKRIIGALLVALFLPAVCQQRNSQAPPKFVSRVELVTVPVVVLSRGKHVSGLQKAAFRIEEDGQEKPIASFEEVAPSSSGISTITPPRGIFTNEIVQEGPVSLTVIALDLINTPYYFQDQAKQRLLEYLKTSYRPDRPTMLAVLDPRGLRILHDFTTDPKVLEKLVHALKSRTKDIAGDLTEDSKTQESLLTEIDIDAEYSALNHEFFDEQKPEASYKNQVAIDSLELTFSELQQLAHALASVRGMKTLIWAFGGISLPSAINSRSQVWQHYEDTLKLLSDASTVVAAVDTYPETDNPGFVGAMYQRPQTGTSGLPFQGQVQIVQNLMDIAQRTGGDYCLLRRDRHCFEEMADYSSHYYLLTYYTQPSDVSRWHKLHVTVGGEHLNVRARSGFFNRGVTDNSDERRKIDIAQAAIAPVEYRGLPLSVRWTQADNTLATRASTSATDTAATAAPRLRKRAFQVGMAPGSLTVDAVNGNHMQLDIVALAMDRSGKVVSDSTRQLDLHPNAAELEHLRTKGFIYSNAIDLPPSAEKMRFIVRDNLSEQIGTVSVPLN
jgi:VWFA-related protein